MIVEIALFAIGLYACFKTHSWLVAIVFILCIAFYRGFRTMYRRYHGEE